MKYSFIATLQSTRPIPSIFLLSSYLSHCRYQHSQFHPHDDSASSVLAYAIDELNVSHIIVTGHLRCGGAAACHAAASKPPGPAAVETPLGRWLEPLTAIARERTYTLEELVEVNVKKQVTNITNADTVRNAWKRGQDIWVHGWVYDIPDGRIRDLGVSVGKPGH